MILMGEWDEDWKKLKCPYCGHLFLPRVYSNLVVKQCPMCHRYFLLPREVVVMIVRNPKNTKVVREYVKKLGWLVDDMSDEELRSYLIEKIEDARIMWDARGWFSVSS
ncbi:MAG: hypothetical protein B6D57_03450 [Candidatus Coatesbacteria bacterium 4484_99]|uniref:Uncharacterized protein n=1 Tax=Candidatus Coatesbacteria bacterium 4484_99 TaxID=1970774 RepID=A0A1W9S0R5_9BACT|nr:MAG: hypothetical protein B6D57_03450 [Candidatus Coatesbacteria bacterium 4484_99]